MINKCDKMASCHVPGVSGLSRIDDSVGLFSSTNRPRFVISPVPCNNSLSARDCRDYTYGSKVVGLIMRYGVTKGEKSDL